MTTAIHETTDVHESGLLHATGEALYTDDLPAPEGLLHAAIAVAPVARGRIVRRDAAPARAVAGVVDVLVAEDIPGHALVGPIVQDEPLLAHDLVHFRGQAVALVLARTRDLAIAGAAAFVVEVAPEPPVLTIERAEELGWWHTQPHVIAVGDVEAALASAPLVVTGTVRTGAQDHFYLETHVALAHADEAGGMVVWSGTQHPSEVQREVASVLGWPVARVTCRCPRLGGGFGGKESQSTPFAALAALGAYATGRPVKLRLDRGQDMRWTGKRHPFRGVYRAGFDLAGKILALDVALTSDGGWSLDLSGPVMDRALFHSDSAYKIPALRFVGRVAKTNLPSSTAFRGFGGPQGMAVVEDAMNHAAERLGMDPAQLRRANLYEDGDRCPYGQKLKDVRLGRITRELFATAKYTERRAAIERANPASAFTKRGIGYQPVKFGISFTNAMLNQAGALVLLYPDGSVQLNHGGTEMGQGLHTKMRAVAAQTLGVALDRVRVMTTATDKVPNTSATAASSGSDLNGQAVRLACETIRERLRPIAASELGTEPALVRFADGAVSAGNATSVPLATVARRAWIERVPLSATGYYATPGIRYDARAGRGTPFFYFAYGAAVVEVEIDTLTGQFGLTRVDILHDCGASLAPNIDKGQVEGGFVQGLGWLTAEEVRYGPDGALLTHGPSTYKIPALGDVPTDWHVALLERAAQDGTIHGSKAVGEPPLMLALAVVTALRHAIRACGTDPVRPVRLALPATHEAVLRAIEDQR